MTVFDHLRNAASAKLIALKAGGMAADIAITPSEGGAAYELTSVMIPEGPRPDGPRPAMATAEMVVESRPGARPVQIGDLITHPDWIYGTTDTITSVVEGVDAMGPGGAVIAQQVTVRLPLMEVEG